MRQSSTPSFFVTFLAYVSLLFPMVVFAEQADLIVGTWVGFDNNNYPGQLRSVDLDLQLDPSADSLEVSDPGALLTDDGEMLSLKGRMTTTHLQGRPNNLNFVDQVFSVKAGFIPSLKVLILLPYGEGRFGSREQQLAVLSADGQTLAFIKTPRSSGWPLPWVLSRKGQADEKLKELAAIKQAGPFGGSGINSFAVTLQNFKPRLNQQQVNDGQQAIERFRQRLARAVLSRDTAAVAAINQAANEKSREMAQAIILSGAAAAASSPSGDSEKACPVSVLSWYEAVEAVRESARFDSFLEIFNAFRPEVFKPHFGKNFLAMSEAERTALFYQMDRYCSRDTQLRRSQLYKHLQFALWGGLAAGGNSHGPYAAAIGVRALEVFDAWQQEVISITQADSSEEQAEKLAEVLNAFAGSFGMAKANDLRNYAAKLVASQSPDEQDIAAQAAATPAIPSPRNQRPAVSNINDRGQRESHKPQKVQTDSQLENAKAANLLKLEAQIIGLVDAGCILGGCEERCRSKPQFCPGGEEAAKIRGAWKKCSGSDWSSHNCQVIISRFGKHSQSTPITVPGPYRSLYASLQSGQAFAPTEKNMAFVAGLGGYLTNACQILGPEDAQVVNSFAKAGEIYATMGNNYMNPGRNLGTATSATATMLAGIRLGQNIACRMPDAYFLAKGITASIKASDGVASNQPSRFVSSCSRQFSEGQCQCLADLGRATFSDIHTRSYNRAIIRQMIERNPMLGLGIGFQCQIYNY